jgi:hypothetical protein
MRELLKDYLRKRENEKLSYDDFLRRKVERSQASVAAGRVHSQAEIEADVLERRERFERLAAEAEK